MKGEKKEGVREDHGMKTAKMGIVRLGRFDVQLRTKLQWGDSYGADLFEEWAKAGIGDDCVENTKSF